ncbi:DUF7710 domain-containing protein [Chitinophaga ginsengisoli]|uniref:DUF7710 domain-containing protein n=1 Tax=Chitinophaga ginsengisoli TaxID=363837 RepID=A0A2P8FXD0_9BACT|nr:hypothetical protein [Chitinophaga ginsengisoli]PSL26372.1 hypothetical protein CLV42_11183 [Chitinophaga ginsengisoli]
MNVDVIWVFHGINGRFASGVFTERKLAKEWIFLHKLTGVLTAYPVNIGVYDWAISSGIFTQKREEHSTPEFIGRFTAGGQEHFHYEDGIQI